MNIELLEKVKQQILEHPETFDMSTFCGTACCIGGWIERMSEQKRPENMDYSNFASMIVGCNWRDMNLLFLGRFAKDKFLTDITPQEAAKAIDDFIAKHAATNNL